MQVWTEIAPNQVGTSYNATVANYHNFIFLCVKFHNTLKFMVICKCCKVVGSYKILNGIFNLQNCKKKNCFVNVNLMDTFKFNSILHTQPTKILREFFFQKIEFLIRVIHKPKHTFKYIYKSKCEFKSILVRTNR